MKTKVIRLTSFLAAIAVCVMMLFAIPSDVSAGASVSCTGGYGYGDCGQIAFDIRNATQGEVITVTISFSGTLTRAYDTLDHELYANGNTITASFTVNNIYNPYYCIYVIGENITSVSFVSASSSGGAAPTSTPVPSPTSTPVPTPTPVPVSAPTSAPASNTTEAAAAEGTPETTSAAAPEQTQPVAQPRDDAQTEAPAPADIQTAAPVIEEAVPVETAAVTEAAVPVPVIVETTAPVSETAQTAAAAAPVFTGGNNNGDVSALSETQEEITSDESAAQEAEPAESTVPVVILGPDGKLIVVTPTPTVVPVAGAVKPARVFEDIDFPVKTVVYTVIAIAVIGTRYFVLKNEGYSGSRLALEFIPGVSELAERRERKKMEKYKAKHNARARLDDSSSSGANSVSSSAAEAARAAQAARAEIARERAAQTAAGTGSAPTGMKPPVKRPPSASVNHAQYASSTKVSGGTVVGQTGKKVVGASRPAYKNGGVPTAEGFKFTAPVQDRLPEQEGGGAQPSPFKMIDKGSETHVNDDFIPAGSDLSGASGQEEVKVRPQVKWPTRPNNGQGG